MCQGLGPKKHDEISEIDRSLQYIIEADRGCTEGWQKKRKHEKTQA